MFAPHRAVPLSLTTWQRAFVGALLALPLGVFSGAGSAQQAQTWSNAPPTANQGVTSNPVVGQYGPSQPQTYTGGLGGVGGGVTPGANQVNCGTCTPAAHSHPLLPHTHQNQGVPHPHEPAYHTHEVSDHTHLDVAGHSHLDIYHPHEPADHTHPEIEDLLGGTGGACEHTHGLSVSDPTGPGGSASSLTHSHADNGSHNHNSPHPGYYTYLYTDPDCAGAPALGGSPTDHTHPEIQDILDRLAALEAHTHDSGPDDLGSQLALPDNRDGLVVINHSGLSARRQSVSVDLASSVWQPFVSSGTYTRTWTQTNQACTFTPYSGGPGSSALNFPPNGTRGYFEFFEMGAWGTTTSDIEVVLNWTDGSSNTYTVTLVYANCFSPPPDNP